MESSSQTTKFELSNDSRGLLQEPYVAGYVDCERSELERLTEVINSVAMDIDSRAIIELIVLYGGLSGDDEALLREEYGQRLYRSGILSELELDSEGERKRIDYIATIAVQQTREIAEKMDDNDASLPLDEQEQRSITNFLQTTRSLLVGIYTYELVTDAGDGVTLESLENMYQGVTPEERKSGIAEPERKEVKEVLGQIINEKGYPFQEITEEIRRITGLNPARMKVALEEVALNPKVAEVMELFYDRWVAREKYENLRILVTAKAISRFLQVGADTDFVYVLLGFPPHGERMKRANRWGEGARSDLALLIPYFTGQSLENLRRKKSTYFGVFQQSRQYAAVMSKKFPEGEWFLDTVKSPGESRAFAGEVMSAIRETFPIFDRLGARVLYMGEYGVGKSMNFGFHVFGESGEPQIVLISAIDAWCRSTPNLIRSHVHELVHYARKALSVVAIENDFCSPDGLEVAMVDISIKGQLEEFFSRVAEGLLPLELSGLEEISDSPSVDPYSDKEKLYNPILGDSIRQAMIKTRQLPYGIANWRAHETIQLALRYCVAEQGKSMSYKLLSKEDLRSIRGEVHKVADSVYRLMYDFLGIDPGYRSVGTELDFLGGGLDYILSGGKGEKEEPYEAAIRILKSRSDYKHPFEDRDIRAIFFSLILVALYDKDVDHWLNYLQTCKPDEAYKQLLSIGIKKEQI